MSQKLKSPYKLQVKKVKIIFMGFLPVILMGVYLYHCRRQKKKTKSKTKTKTEAEIKIIMLKTKIQR